MRFSLFPKKFAASAAAMLALSGCLGGGGGEGAVAGSQPLAQAPLAQAPLAQAPYVGTQEQPGEQYVIGPLDQLQIFVWRNPELSSKVQVRPDGRITTPLINDMPAVGKTPAMLADDLKIALGEYIKDPIVSVIVENFSGTFSQQVRIVGATEKPASIPFRANMTVLDAMISVGGLSEFAAGNKAKLVRYDRTTGRQQEYRLRLNSLLKKGDSSANVALQPGDVIIIPTSMF